MMKNNSARVQTSKRSTGGSDDWQTPRDIIETLEDIIGKFTIDACASRLDTIAPKFYRNLYYSLRVEPPKSDDIVWCNPPFSKAAELIPSLIESAITRGYKLVIILPVRPETKFWREHIWKDSQSDALIIMQKRVKFLRFNGIDAANAPFPTALFCVNLAVNEIDQITRKFGFRVALMGKENE